MSDKVGPCHHGKIGDEKSVCLVILDGWGLRDRDEGNAIRQAKTPNMERLWHENPHAVLQASGMRQWGCRKAKWERARLAI